MYIYIYVYIYIYIYICIYRRKAFVKDSVSKTTFFIYLFCFFGYQRNYEKHTN